MRQPKLHKWADKCTEILIYFMVIFSPWAFGTTQHWSIWTMNITAYGLGALLVSKWIIRWSTSFRPWPSVAPKNEISPRQHCLRLINKYCNLLTAICMLLLLGYILTSAINARASFNLETHEYTYFEGINRSLPHSYDAKGTWFLFWQYLGLIILFWATRDWLGGSRPTRSSISLNPRLKRLLFLICLNVGALALECILQRIYYGDYRGKLLFLVEPVINHQNIAQFGPFAYRSNAASYLNLIWPLGLGLLIQLGRENLDHGKRRIGSGPELLLIPCIILAASGPIISSARGGALVMIGLLILVAVSLMFIKVRSKFLRFSVSMALFAGLGTAYHLGWEKIEPRLVDLMQGLIGRSEISEVAIKMIDEYPVFGSGPGSFEAVAQFELGSSFTIWESWVHNDYLEFYLTFGGVGGVIIVAIMVLLIMQYITIFWRDSIGSFQWFALLAAVGLATHAIMDFPLQVYSILTLLTVIGTVIVTNKTAPVPSNRNIIKQKSPQLARA